MNKITNYNKYDFSLVEVTLSQEDVKSLCAYASSVYGASVLVPQCFLSSAKTFLKQSSAKLATAVGYPYGNVFTDVKILECKLGMKNGAEEFEVYPNISFIKKRMYDDVQKELVNIKKVLKNKVVKLVLDDEILTIDEQIAVSTIATSSQIDYIMIKSSKIAVDIVGNAVRIKDACGDSAKIKVFCQINSANDINMLLSSGVERIGSYDYTNVDKLVEEEVVEEIIEESAVEEPVIEEVVEEKIEEAEV